MRILVPTAGRQPAAETAEYIAAIASRLGATLVALHIGPNDSAHAGDDSLRIFARAATEASVPYRLEMGAGDVVPCIIDFTERLDVSLVVMGASRGRIVSEWLSADVMKRSDVPVVVIPHQVDHA